MSTLSSAASPGNSAPDWTPALQMLVFAGLNDMLGIV